MDSVPLAEATARLGELVERASQGEPTQITLRGRPVARITAEPAPHEPFDWDELARLRDTMPMQPEGAGEFMRRLRDEEPY